MATNRIGPGRVRGSDVVTRASVTASTSATQAIAANKTRVQVTIFNGGTVDVYVGDSAVSTTNYEAIIAPRDLYVEDRDLGALYVRTSTSTAACYVKETY